MMPRRRLSLVLACLCLAAPGPSRSAEAVPHKDGFWKCRQGAGVKGEYGNEDPVGLAGHSHIPTDCALHWSDGHGKTYCFASQPSFLECESDPSVLSKADAFWRAGHP